MLKRLDLFVSAHFFDLFLGFLVVLNAAPFLAPVFAHIGWELPAEIIYRVYSFLCHQFDWRSIHIFDHQVAWCTRDVFIWGSFLLVALIVRFKGIKPMPWYWIIPFTVPIALDGVIQTVATIFGYVSADPLYMSTNLMRMLTGTLWGVGLGMVMLPLLYSVSGLTPEAEEKQSRAGRVHPLTVALVAPVLMGVIYVLLVAVWQATSPMHPPANALDFAVKTPVKVEDWLVRTENGL
ncbi:MAG: hypothetical protein TR69_WS6001001259 [candidate division WS6 bacterium OLB20]|uniref:DUF2085 domain-containing protein n=1 Tax=candidate division WS6 bacterium OLB20 TaxID=1617426 RepID=A0A136LWE5_9BACT|nr:MAG: hypothetical protein TR69_WS6001001259 [candidate division WS6 bacterium OLB20]